MKEYVKSIDDVFIWLDNICNIEKYLTDDELSYHFNEVTTYCAGNNKNRDIFFITHIKKEELIKKRVKKYCKKKKISLDEYDGPLPYKLFIFKDEKSYREDKLNKIIKKIKIKKFLKKINIFK